MTDTPELHFTSIRNQVDAMMDLLYGSGVANHNTIIEQINYLVFLRALTKKDDDAIVVDDTEKQIFKGELAKYRWDNLLMLNAESLFTTLEEVFRKLPELTTNKTISLLYRDAHVKIYEKPTLRRLLHAIEKLMADLDAESGKGYKDIFGDMYEYLLSKLAQAGTMGQFRTPRHIIKFIVDVLEPSKRETILDPAVGTAGFLVAALEFLKHTYTSEEYKKVGKYPMDLLSTDERNFLLLHTFTGFDSDQDMIKFGLMNLYLHHLEHPQIKRQNTLVDTAGDRTKWDIILANPPFAGALDQDSISQDLRMGTRATEILFLRYMIDHLSDRGRAGVIVPEGIIFSNSNAHKKIRQLLIEEAGLWCVVSLPPGVFNPYAGVKTSIVFFDKTLVGKNNKTLFVKIQYDGFDLGASKRPIDKNDLPKALDCIKKYKENNYKKRNLETSNIDNLIQIVSKEKIIKSEDYNLSPERYRETVTTINQKWPLVHLGDVSEVISGQSPESKYYNDIGEGLPFYQGKTEFTDKYLGKPQKWTTKITKKAQENDILMSVRAPVGPINMCTQEICIGRGLAAIRSKDNILRNYLYFFLKSMENKIKGNSGAVFDSISREQIMHIQIPLPPLKVQQEIVEELDNYQKIIDGAKQAVENWKPEIKIDPTWKTFSLQEICDVRDGTHDSPKYASEGYPLITSKNIVNNTIDFSNVNLISKVDLDKINKRSNVDSGDILMPMIGTIGNPIVVLKDREFGIKNVALIKLYKESKINAFFLKYILESDLFSDHLKKSSSGSTQKFISLGFIRKLKIPLPTIEIQQEIVSQIEEEQKIVDANKKLIQIFEGKIKDKIAEVWEENA